MKHNKLLRILAVLVVLGAVGGLFTWYKFFREEAQPEWITQDPDMRFKYGSIGAERDAGIPYWIFYVLPRMFPVKSGAASDAQLYGPYVGRITRIEDVGTDRHRVDSFTYELAVQLGTIYAGYPHRYCHYRKTFGYANAPLDGVWLRAPYLHNGSVPTLRDLLEPSSARPRVFYRGNDLYDAQRVGFVSDVAEHDGRRFFAYDTSLPGNSNAGHEGARYGTELSPADKDALVEHLKTF